jgi:hypothetical protein
MSAVGTLVRTAMCVGLVAMCPRTAAADPFTLAFTTTGFTQTGIGNLNGGDFDKLFVFGLSGTVDLTPNVAVDVVINRLRFEAGFADSAPPSTAGVIERSITLESLTGPLFNSFRVQFGTPQTGDVLTVFETTPSAFGLAHGRNVLIVPHGLPATAVGIGFPTSGCCTFETDLTASFLLQEAPVPEPGTMLLLGSGFLMTARQFARSRKRPECTPGL